MNSPLILILDIFGTAVFAATGAVKGVRCRFDIFGVAVLACCVGVGGGIVRDTILGALPVAALCNWHYLCVCIIIALVIFMTSKYWMYLRNVIQIGDAIGLGVFTAIGALKGMEFEISLIGIVLCGMFTAIGGGVIRDVLTSEIPVVLRSDFYATASLIGGLICCFLDFLRINWFYNFLITAFVVTGIRLLAIHYRIQLPSAHPARRR